MNLLSRDSWLAIALVISLLIIAAFAAVQQTYKQQYPPLSSFSSDPNGTKALQLWLTEQGYTVQDEPLTVFTLSEEIDIIFLFEPYLGITPNEWREFDEWVENGGTLLIVGHRFGTLTAVGHYEFNVRYMEAMTATLTTQTPLLTAPPFEQAEITPAAFLTTERTDYITHLAVADKPITVSFSQGLGQVIISTTPFPFSNAGLKEAGNPAFVMNLINKTPTATTVWFDEWHHGWRGAVVEMVGPINWLRYTPTGRALLYVGVVIFIAMVLQGRIFGRPIPLIKDITRRGPVEYVTAMANLSRRAGHRRAVLQQYHHHLKRELGQRYRLNPTLPDDSYLAELQKFNPTLEIEQLRQLLGRLSQPKVNERDLIQLSIEVTQWLKKS